MDSTSIHNSQITGYKSILGFDEVGRGPLAGPVVVAGVYQDTLIQIPKEIIIRDSKKMTPKQRAKSKIWIKQNFIFGFGQVSSSEIDQIGINKSIKKSANQALQLIKQQVDILNSQIYVDGRDKWFRNCTTVIKGEDKYSCIAMASIIAKEYRDGLMKKLDSNYPQWQFGKHMGYGTKHHREMIQQNGLIKGLHRKSFCKKLI